MNKWWIEAGYRSKKELEDKIRGLVASYSDNQTLNMEDQEWILSILNHHNDFKNKAGCGIKSVHQPIMVWTYSRILVHSQ